MFYCLREYFLNSSLLTTGELQRDDHLELTNLPLLVSAF